MEQQRSTSDSDGDIEIRATPEVVWDLLADIDDWPRWNPDVKEATLMGGLRESSVFRWKAGPGTITSTLEKVDRPREIGWRGRTMGITRYTSTSSCRGHESPHRRIVRRPDSRSIETLDAQDPAKGNRRGLLHLQAGAEVRRGIDMLCG